MSAHEKAPHGLGDIDFSTFEDALLGTGRMDDVQYSLPTGYSMWANFVNDDLLAQYGIEAPEGGSDPAEFNEWMASVTEASGGEVYGGTDYTGSEWCGAAFEPKNGNWLFVNIQSPGFTAAITGPWRRGAL